MKLPIIVICMAIAGVGTLGAGQPSVVRADQGGNGMGRGIETACAAHAANHGKSYAYGLACPVATISCPASTGTVGTLYSSAIAAVGGFPPYQSYGASSLPASLSLNTTTGAITGTPTAEGTTTFTATVTDSAGLTASTTCSITVSPAVSSASIVLTATANGDGTFTLTLTGSGLQSGSEIIAHQVNTGQSFTAGFADNSGNFSRVSAGLGCPASIQPVYYTGTAANGQPYTSPIYAPQPC